jgi:hypothetical protein
MEAKGRAPDAVKLAWSRLLPRRAPGHLYLNHFGSPQHSFYSRIKDFIG